MDTVSPLWGRRRGSCEMCLLSHCGDAGAHILDSSKHLREKAAGGTFSQALGTPPSSVNNTRLAVLSHLVLEDS